MPATMSDLQREREILDEDLTESRFAFAESLKNGLGTEIKDTLASKKEAKNENKKKSKKPSFFKRFLMNLAEICQ